MRKILRPLYIVFFSGIFISLDCIYPFAFKIENDTSFLVVDGLITNENSSYSVFLSRSYQNAGETPGIVPDATVTITDGTGNTEVLQNMGNGVYKTDSTRFTGVTGRVYTLHIMTYDGKEYASEPCTMYPVSPIDSIWYAKDEGFVGKDSTMEKGLKIYARTKTARENDFLRWEYQEVWKFYVPDPQEFIYYSSDNIVPNSDVTETCWKSNNSSDVLIYSANSGIRQGVINKPIVFIAPSESDRLTIEYSILIRQYSISSEEYDFWNDFSYVNEAGGDIFGSQPFSVTGNIHNISKSNEKVLGYFKVSSVNQLRKFITFNDLIPLGLPPYISSCQRIEVSPYVYDNSVTWDGLYEMFMGTGNYDFVEPEYNGTSLTNLVFALKGCADCSASGTSTKPDFWVDLK
ncbi:MAG: DUF4249 domain-containing protein [Bacteroidales bacterium]|jgi:hypothetical protein